MRTKSIHQAAKDGDLKAVDALLNESPDLVNVQGQGDSVGIPLHWAAANSHKDVAELLLARGAHVNQIGNAAGTPLHWAADGGHTDVAELLLAHNADVNAKDFWDRTPLQTAKEKGHRDVVALLDHHVGPAQPLPDVTKELAEFDLFRLLGDCPLASGLPVMFGSTRKVVGGAIRLVDLYFENGIVLWNVRIANERIITVPREYGAFPIKKVGVPDLDRHRNMPPMKAETR